MTMNMSEVRGVAGATTAMCIVGTLTAVSATLHDYPLFGGQALRYTVAAAILLLVARHGERDRPRPRLALRAPGRGAASRRSAPGPRMPESGRLATPVTTTRTGTGTGTGARSPVTWIGPREIALIVALGATGLVWFNICVVTATRYASPPMLSTIIATVPVVLAVAGPLQQGARPAGRTVLGAMVVTAGAGVATGLGNGGLAGVLWSVGALAGEACFSLLAVPLLPRLGAVRVSAYAAAVSVPMLLVAGLVADGPERMLAVPTVDQVLALAYLGAFVTTIGFLVWYDALGRLGADRAGLFAGVMPVASLLTTMVLERRAPHPADVAGAVLVGAGVVVGLGKRAVPDSAGVEPGRNLVGAVSEN
jgi:drug/metabolite transporter (DMT)-like permease